MIRSNEEQQYIRLKQALAEMSDIVLKMATESAGTLVSKDVELAQNLMQRDARVDELELKVDDICTKIIALYEPKAAQVRYIVTALRIVVDIERMGDHARKIAKQSIKLAELPINYDFSKIVKMASICANMMEKSMTAFFGKDPALAEEVLSADQSVDDLQDEINAELLTMIAADPTQAKNILKIINITRRIERMADHATNVAEVVSFIHTGTRRIADKI